jgi:hypothetical protein
MLKGQSRQVKDLTSSSRRTVDGFSLFLTSQFPKYLKMFLKLLMCKKTLYFLRVFLKVASAASQNTF